MKRVWSHLTVRPRMSLALVIGVVAGLYAPASTRVSQGLIGWNVGVWSYLAMMAWTMARADHGQLRRTSLAHAEGAAVVLGLVIAASVASVAAIVAELAWARTGHGSPLALAHVGLAVSTLVGVWLLLPVVFTLSYASHYYHHAQPGGLKFPDEDPRFQPNYVDFLYFSFTLAVAAQTADVVITNRTMRGLVLLQAVLSFGFNAAILALAINIAAGLLPSVS
ncbi:DUF1345 domain-containing protein [Ideonella sp.]|uniref:DUF1345 domain-containing protein n=1 Tax=Ideonella sp. TaxID=1929293 RepID=UPI0035AEF265